MKAEGAGKTGELLYISAPWRLGVKMWNGWPRYSLKHFGDPPTLRWQMRTWIKSSRVLAATAALFYIFHPTSVLADALDVWHTNATFSASGIAYGNGKFVAVGGNSFRVSADGVTWTQYVSPPVLYYEGIAFGGGVFMAYGYPVSTNQYGPRYILQSFDGFTWTKVYETPSLIRGATYGNGRFVFVGDQIIFTTLNPFQWTEFSPNLALGGVAFGAGRFVAVSAEPSVYPPSGSAYILSSADGIIWRYDYSAVNQSLRNVAYGNGLFVATWRTNNPNFGTPGNSTYERGFLTSSNLASWQSVKLDLVGLGLAGIAFGGDYFIGAIPNKTYTSTNGLDWINRVAANGTSKFAFGAGTFVANGNDSFPIVQSDVFAPTSNSPPSYLTIATFPGVTIQGNEGQTYRIEYTTNLAAGSNWLTLTNISLPSSTYLWVDTSSPTVGRRFYRAVLVE